jgi:hypothetical protein
MCQVCECPTSHSHELESISVRPEVPSHLLLLKRYPDGVQSLIYAIKYDSLLTSRALKFGFFVAALTLL